MEYKGKSKSPAYLALYEELRREIENEAYPYKTKLPSKRNLAEKNGVSIITVEHSLDLLRDEGYIESMERSGYYVIFRKSEFFTNGKATVTPLALPRRKESYYMAFPFSVISKTMRKVISDYGEEIMIKTENTGCKQLRGAISRYLSRSRGINVNEDNIVIGAGSEYLYGLIVQLLGKERTYSIENPSYNMIEKVYRAEGAGCELLTLGNDGIISQELINAKGSVLHITPYRSYPSGVTASATKRMEYIAWANSRSERFVVEDDYESEFTPSTKPERTLFSLADKENVIYMNTFSNTIASAIRIGYMVLPDRLINTFNSRVGFYSCTVPTYEQLVLSELIDSGDFERHINKVRHKRRTEKSGRS